MMKLAFFDIDGTLLNFGEPDIHSSIKQALNQLQKNGTKIFLATGRAPYEIPQFSDLHFDGFLSFNGGYCFNEKEVIFSYPMDHSDIEIIIQNGKEIGLSTMLATDKRMGANFFEQNLEDSLQISKNHCKVIEDYDALMQEDVYQLMVGSLPDQDNLLIQNTKHSAIARWWDRAVDIIPSSCGKGVALEHIIQYYGCDKEDTIAFGDGGNDLSMIQYAGIGVAMGNAVEEVKKEADYVTDTCKEDGVLTALKHYHLL